MPDIVVGPKPEQFDDWYALFALLDRCFAFMEGRIDPPSSLSRMTPKLLDEKAQAEHLIVAHSGETLVGCGFGKVSHDELYVSKLAVDFDYRCHGIASKIIEALEQVASDLGLKALTLETRVELTENHRTFERLGFRKAGESSHPGHTRATSFMYHKPI
ncbi:MAG: GNAT family N-acetyltransferase [Boseongicola sp.]|nr:GNAT family N-acetyltransferase [Boseongicola sp.]